jgi:Cu-Zn family superoxide dismutase
MVIVPVALHGRCSSEAAALPHPRCGAVFARNRTAAWTVSHGDGLQSRTGMHAMTLRSSLMTILKSMEMVGITSLLTAGLSLPAAAQSAHTALKDKSGKDVGVVELTQTPGGVLIKLSVKGMPADEHAFHIHNVGKCEAPSFESAGPHFNPDNKHHGILSGEGHAGDMPNLHIPPDGALEVEVVNTAVTLDKGKPNSVFHPGGTSAVIHVGKDDYKSDPAGNAGDRIACGVISEAPPTR